MLRRERDFTVEFSAFPADEHRQFWYNEQRDRGPA